MTVEDVCGVFCKIIFPLGISLTGRGKVERVWGGPSRWGGGGSGAVWGGWVGGGGGGGGGGGASMHGVGGGGLFVRTRVRGMYHHRSIEKETSP